MGAQTHLFGIRHHGPGSARRLVEALDALAPTCVLIEGPSDVSELIPFLADPGMTPPVALLAYAADEPENASFWPFAVYSPEYQAARWALARRVPVRFIDLPVSWRLAARAEPEPSVDGSIESEPEPEPPSPLDPISLDPIGTLAASAGYEDGESWWTDVIEENPDPGPVFAAIADAMGELRAKASPPNAFEAAREAHMRLEIARAEKEVEGAIAVVCGAWHVPALLEKRTQKDDKALLKESPKRKIAATWAPWTSPRLATLSGYGAGVAAPGWCDHLWHAPRETVVTHWLTRIAGVMREAGHIVSTASVIETQRLAVCLAAIRGRPQPGFEELRDAAVACLCYGEASLWHAISPALIIGNQVGSIPDGVPLAPLLEDLKRQQALVKLKPEALERELMIDLRSDAGLARSTLLHRLALLGIAWGTELDPGKSRGSFRERWSLAWKPEFAVDLVENLIYGATIETAASGKLSAQFLTLNTLPQLADATRAALVAQLPDATRHGIARLADRAGQSSDCKELLAALTPIAAILRYGEARTTDTGALGELFVRICVGGAIALPYSARNLDASEAEILSGLVRSADAAIVLLESSDDVTGVWRHALLEIMASAQSSPRLAGVAVSLLYVADVISPEAASAHLAQRLSPGIAAADAAAYFEGFFEGGAERLLHDAPLRSAVDSWISELDEDIFTQYLPLFRRVFSALDSLQRKRLLDSVMGRTVTGSLTGLALSADAAALWPAHLDALKNLLEGKAPS